MHLSELKCNSRDCSASVLETFALKKFALENPTDCGDLPCQQSDTTGFMRPCENSEKKIFDKIFDPHLTCNRFFERAEPFLMDHFSRFLSFHTASSAAWYFNFHLTLVHRSSSAATPRRRQEELCPRQKLKYHAAEDCVKTQSNHSAIVLDALASA
jgi:hypothetical protein